MNRYFKSVFGILVLLVIILQLNDANAQDKSLQECIDLAIKNNLTIQQSGLNVLRSKNDLNQSKYNLLPNVTGSATQNYNFGRSIDPFTNQFTTDPVRNNSFNLNADLNIFSGFQAQNQIKQNRALNEVAIFDFQKAKNDIILNVVTAYTTVIFNGENVNNAKLQLKNSTEQTERTEKLVNAGSLPIGNLYDLRAQMATDELALVNAQNALELSLLNLKQLMNIPSSETLSIVVPELPDPEDEEYPSTVEQIYETALRHMPEVKSATSNIKSSQIGIRIAQSGYMPSLTAFVGSNSFYSSIGGESNIETRGFSQPFPIGTDINGNPVFSLPQPIIVRTFEEKPFLNQLEFNRREFLGLNLSIPLFSKMRNRTNVLNAKLSLENAKLSEQLTKNQLRQIIEQAYNDVTAASKRYSGTKKQLNAREEAFRTAEQRYNVGMMNAVDYLLAQNNLNRARSELLQAKFDFIFKSKILDFYLQKPLEF